MSSVLSSCTWTDEEVWQYIRDSKIPYCELYDKGHKRIGCIGCPLSGSKGMKRDFERFPQFERAWKAAVIGHWKQWRNVPNAKGKPRYTASFASGEDFWNWWVSGKRREDEETCQMEKMWTN